MNLADADDNDRQMYQFGEKDVHYAVLSIAPQICTSMMK